VAAPPTVPTVASPAGSAAAPAAGSPAAGGPRRAFSVPAVPAPWIFSALLTLILVVGQYFFRIVGGYERLAVALGTAIAMELLLSRLLRGRWPNILSAYISGNSIAILTKPAASLLWPFAVGSALAISSKYVLTYRGRHLWNPTNFAISALLLVAPGSMAILSHQWGNHPSAVAIVFTVGLMVVWRARLMHITGTYLGCFVALAALRSAINGQPLAAEVAPVTGPMYTLLMFFMLTDPRTVVSTRRGRVLVVVLIALLECAIRLLPLLNVPVLEPLLWAPPIFALAIIGPIAKWLDIRRTTTPRGAPVAPAAVAAPA
jgi:Na+-translocating ferredoxin:NAD+ oxidoreductase RnfD subunit